MTLAEVLVPKILKARGERGLREVQTSAVMEAFDQLVLKRHDYVSIRQVEHYSDDWKEGIHYLLATNQGLVPFATRSTKRKAQLHRKNRPMLVHTTIALQTGGGSDKTEEDLMIEIEERVDNFFLDQELSKEVKAFLFGSDSDRCGSGNFLV